MKVIFLGTNGWYDASTGNTICTLVETNQYTIILDAGNGIYKLDQHIDFAKPAYLFLSHFHLDHIIGLHIMGKFNFRNGLCICGQEGIESILDKIINTPFSIPFNQLDFKTEYLELPEKEGSLPFKMKSLSLVHSSPCLGFRFEIDNKVLAYCTDTGYCENAIELSRQADLLIAECSFKPGQENKDWPHLNPETAAQIARVSGAKKLALIHFDAEIYKTITERKESEKEAKNIFNNSFIAKDDMAIEIK